jgi:beta-galactosidase
MCGEFWCGWFDHWYEEHHVRTADSTVEDVRTMLDMGASFNMYMFHGGTNFGFWNGANDPGDYQPTITSYDYCAPLTEDGSCTDTYYALQKLFCEKDGRPVPAPAPQPVRAAYGEVTLTERLPLPAALPQLSAPVSAPNTLTFEQMGLDFGYALYSTVLRGPFEKLPLNFGALHDRAHVFVDGKLRSIQERDRRCDGIELELQAGESVRLDILVENMGRVNYGPRMFDEKGILGGVRLGQQYHFGWTMYPLAMEGLSALPFVKEAAAFDGTPAFLRGTLHVEGEPADTFLRPVGLEKGFVTVNGFNIGRYYNSAGPTRTLYVPAPLLRAGDNEIIVFESDAVAAEGPLLVSEGAPDLGDPQVSEY